jgi:predicted Rossmann-fold nucleotide-binding protein
MGLMGTVSQAVLDNGGHVTGVSPYAMVAAGGEGPKTLEGVTVDKVSNREPPPHPNRVNIVVGSMHDRKLDMAKRADGGFVALPGGFGTLEEVSKSA